MVYRFWNFFLVSSLLLFLTATAPMAFAQEKNNFSLTIQPAYQEVEIPEDKNSVETTITLKNPSDTAQQMELFAFDFTQSDHFGSIALLDGFTGQYAHTLASFLSFEKDSLIIAAQSEEEVVIKIENRATLSPGGHYAAIVVRAIEKQGASQQKILPAVTSLLLVRKKSGERINLSLKELSWQPKALVTHFPEKIDLTFENGGNVHVVPRGTAAITDIFGRVVFQGTVNESSLYLLPGTMRTISTNLQQSRTFFPLMFYSLEIHGRSNVGEATFSSETSFLYVDWKFVVLLLIIVGAIIFRTVQKKKRNEKK